MKRILCWIGLHRWCTRACGKTLLEGAMSKSVNYIRWLENLSDRRSQVDDKYSTRDTLYANILAKRLEKLQVDGVVGTLAEAAVALIPTGKSELAKRCLQASKDLNNVLRPDIQRVV